MTLIVDCLAHCTAASPLREGVRDRQKAPITGSVAEPPCLAISDDDALERQLSE